MLGQVRGAVDTAPSHLYGPAQTIFKAPAYCPVELFCSDRNVLSLPCLVP